MSKSYRVAFVCLVPCHCYKSCLWPYLPRTEIIVNSLLYCSLRHFRFVLLFAFCVRVAAKYVGVLCVMKEKGKCNAQGMNNMRWQMN